MASQQRHLLPGDLAGALKRLDDVEIDALLAAATTEAERRGLRPPSPAKEQPMAKPQRRQEAAEDGAGLLTTGKLNAVRAAFKAGVKPSAIARQFGISQSDVRKASMPGERFWQRQVISRGCLGYWQFGCTARQLNVNTSYTIVPFAGATERHGVSTRLTFAPA